jgi:hypothetical protein
MECYPDAEEEISDDLPTSKGTTIRMTVYADTDHAHDMKKVVPVVSHTYG